MPDRKLSPAELVFGYRVNGFLPDIKNKILMQPGSPWHENMEARDVKLKRRKEDDHSKWMV